MATLNDLFPSKFLTKEDVGQGQLYTIQRIARENVGKEEDPEEKPVLHFKEINKPFVLNRTNATTISVVYGEEIEGWLGKQIVVYFDPTIQFQGKATGGLRVRAPKGVGPSNDLPF